MSDEAGAVLVATRDVVLRVEPGGGVFAEVQGLDGRNPTCLAGPSAVAASSADAPRPAWCGTTDSGVFRSDDGGRSWEAAGLPDAHVTALAVDPIQEGVVWAGTEPSAVWRGRWSVGSDPTQEGAGSAGGAHAGRAEDGQSADGLNVTWERLDGILELPSSHDWSFPPRPETHHVRWIACHPEEPGRLWAAIEAGALIWTEDAGATWNDRVDGSPHDTHELAIHPERPDVLRVAAGDGYFESADGGRSWRSPMDGLEVGYLRSVVVAPDDPDTVVVSAASKARSAYASFRADGRLYRRQGDGPWRRVLDGWPEEPRNIAPLLIADPSTGRLLAADERGVHVSLDRGRSWEILSRFHEKPAWLRGLALI